MKGKEYLINSNPSAFLFNSPVPRNPMERFTPDQRSPIQNSHYYDRRFQSSMENDYLRYVNHTLFPACLPIPNNQFYSFFKTESSSQKLNKEKKSVILIQSCFRSFKARQDLLSLENNSSSLAALNGFIKVAKLLKIKRSFIQIRNYSYAKRAYEFLSFSATFVQKNWRAYSIRKLGHLNIFKRLRAKKTILALYKGWKTRRILKSKDFLSKKSVIMDMLKLLTDLDNSSVNLAASILNQLPVLKQKFIDHFNKVFLSGKIPRNVKEEPIRIIHPQEKPILPIRVDSEYDTFAEPSANTPKSTQKKKFLKKGANLRYNPLERAKQKTPKIDKNPKTEKPYDSKFKIVEMLEDITEDFITNHVNSAQFFALRKIQAKQSVIPIVVSNQHLSLDYSLKTTIETIEKIEEAYSKLCNNSNNNNSL